MRNLSFVMVFFVLVLGIVLQSYAHCQIPCGIFDDQTRFTLLREHITTMEKSINQIVELSRDPAANINQLVRWVNNKDEHADEFTHIVTYYFLAQRIKIADESNQDDYTLYQKKVTLLHQLIVFSMKCKQSTDLPNVEKLKTLVNQFEDIYFSPEDKKHMQEHHK